MSFREKAIEMLRGMSGAGLEAKNRFNIFNKIIGFKGVTDGVGCSTIVANTAIQLAKNGLNVCVIDTSILTPSQYYLLKCEEYAKDEKDWFDLATMDNSYHLLKPSKYGNNIMVLSFEHRNINDFVSTFDNEELVTSTFGILEKLYDVILVDICSEVTNITTACAIHCHKIYQVVSDEYIVLSNFESYLNNMKIRCCPIDKLKHVIVNKNNVNTEENWKGILDKYKFKLLTVMPFSGEFYQNACLGKNVFSTKTTEKELNDIVKGYDVITQDILGISRGLTATKETKKSKNSKESEDVIMLDIPENIDEGSQG